jgi:hypothetical protein
MPLPQNASGAVVEVVDEVEVLVDVDSVVVEVVAAVEVVVDSVVDVVVVDDVVVSRHGFGSQLPGPRSCPPAAVHAADVSCSQRSKAPPVELWRQQTTGEGVEVVVVEEVDVLVVELSVVVVVVVPMVQARTGHASTRTPPRPVHSSGFRNSQVPSVLPAETGTQHGTSVGGWVVVVVVGVVVVVVPQGSGSQVPGPTTVPPKLVHSSGFSSSQVSSSSGNAPPGETGRQHWTSCATPAGAQPFVAASHQLANGLTQKLPLRGALHLAAGTTLHRVRPRRVVVQQLTHPGRPQVDLVAHCIAWCIRFRDSRRAATSAFSALPTQRR